MNLKAILVLLFLLTTSFGQVVLPNNDQMSLSTTAQEVVGVNSSRKSTLIRNLDAAITIYIGYTSSVSATNGTELRAGEPMTLNTTRAIFAIAASGTPRISWATE